MPYLYFSFLECDEEVGERGWQKEGEEGVVAAGRRLRQAQEAKEGRGEDRFDSSVCLHTLDTLQES